MPDGEDSLGLEDLFGLEEGFSEELAVVGDVSVHVVHHEWLAQAVLVVGERHGFEVEGHGGAGLNISNFVPSAGGVGVDVEETGDGGLVLGEVNIIGVTLPLLVVVDHVVGLGGEETLDLLVSEELVEDPHLIDGGLHALVSDATGGHEREEGEVEFPEKSLVHHDEGEGGVGDQRTGPAVVGSVKTAVDLVEVIAGSDSPLPELASEQVVGVLEVVGVPVGLGLNWSARITRTDSTPLAP